MPSIVVVILDVDEIAESATMKSESPFSTVMPEGLSVIFSENTLLSVHTRPIYLVLFSAISFQPSIDEASVTSVVPAAFAVSPVLSPDEAYMIPPEIIHIIINTISIESGRFLILPDDLSFFIIACPPIHKEFGNVNRSSPIKHNVYYVSACQRT